MVTDPDVTDAIIVDNALYDLRDGASLPEKIQGLMTLSSYGSSLPREAYRTFVAQRDSLRPNIEDEIERSHERLRELEDRLYGGI